MRKYYSEQGAENYARETSLHYGWSVFSSGWYVGTKEQLKNVGVTEILTPVEAG